ncbi:MAG: glycosyltransferase, partial [Desulfocucumaceae bacterium]
GTPVVAFNRGSMPEIIENGANGFLVGDVCSAAEAVRSLDAISRRKCRKIVEERFSRERMVEDYIAVYHKIIDKRKFKCGEALQ